MNWIENGIWTLALIACSVNLMYLLKFKKNESGDERGFIISGRSAIYSFSVLSGLISILIACDIAIGFTAELYKLSIASILIISNVFSLITHNYIRKQY